MYKIYICKNYKYHYIYTPDGLVAIMKQIGTTKTMQYVAKDHLGSVMALYDDTRTLIEEFSYDAWGRRRNPTNWTYTSVPTATNTRHGFTGHEHLDKYALINMNGRVYDPVTGRFLSPDPYIQNPYSAQNFDRYSYCWNNPLKYVDPSGYYTDISGWKIWPWNWGKRYSNRDYVSRDTPIWGAWNDPFTSDAPWVFGTSGGSGGGAPIGGSAASGPGTGGGGGGGMVPNPNNGANDAYAGSSLQEGGKLLFDGNYLYILDANGNTLHSYPACSGRPLEDGCFDYSVDRQKQEDIGPIPEGEYFINGVQSISTRDRYLGEIGLGGWPGGVDSWGEQRAWIYPLKETVTYGRGGFSIHGGEEPGSAGCIDLTVYSNQFFNDLGGWGLWMLTVSY